MGGVITARTLIAVRSLLACAALCVLLAACALRPHLEPPQLSVSEVDIQGSDLWHQRLRVRMHVQNPNNRVLAVQDLEYTLEVEGQQLASGSNAESFTVPALGETDFDMNVSTNLAGTLLTLLSRGPDALNQGVAYRLTGKVTLSEGWIRSIPFDERGNFKLQ
jgi:LEA14-like dessication related protein